MTNRVGTPIGRHREEFKFGPWCIAANKGSILKSNDAEELSRKLDIPQLPEMTFGENYVKISHTNGFCIEFNAVDALKLVDNKNDVMKVAAAREWIESRRDCEYINHTVKPFDWTYSTDYKGSIFGVPHAVTVSETKECINIEKLKAREKIAYFEQAILFEDELADHGCAELSVKIRVMPTCFFLLMRYFLRVDGLLARIHDTRLFHECGTDYLLREYREKESSLGPNSTIPLNSMTDSHSIDKYLKITQEVMHKLVLNTENPSSFSVKPEESATTSDVHQQV